MRFPFDERKAAQAAVYLIKKRSDQINYMKLNKLLYLADRKALLEAGQPITGDRMVSMPKGPVLSGILDLINWGKRRGQSSAWFEYVSEPSSYDVRLAWENITIEDLDLLSDFERNVLDEIDEQYGRMDKWSLVELTHRLPEWRDPHGSSFPIDPADILREEGWSERDIRRVAQDAGRARFIRDLDVLDIEAE